MPKEAFLMKEQHASQLSTLGVIDRRDFLKLAGAFGLSVTALEALFAQQEVAFAASQDITAGLVGSWGFDEATGTSAADASGSGNTATLSGQPTWTVGKVKASLLFDGKGTSVDIRKNVLATNGSYSVAAWVQLTSTSGWATAVSQDGTNVSGFFLQHTDPNAGNDGGIVANFGQQLPRQPGPGHGQIQREQ